MGLGVRPRPDDQSAGEATALPRPYLLFLGDTVEAGFAKTAFGLRDWAPELCVGEFALPEAKVTTGLPRMTPEDAADRDKPGGGCATEQGNADDVFGAGVHRGGAAG